MKKIDGVIECRFHLGSSGGEELWHPVLIDGAAIIKIFPCSINGVEHAKVTLVHGDVMDLDIPYSVMVDCVRVPGKYFDNGLWKWNDEGRDNMQAAEWTPEQVREYLKNEGWNKFNIKYEKSLLGYPRTNRPKRSQKYVSNCPFVVGDKTLYGIFKTCFNNHILVFGSGQFVDGLELTNNVHIEEEEIIDYLLKNKE